MSYQEKEDKHRNRQSGLLTSSPIDISSQTLMQDGQTILKYLSDTNTDSEGLFGKWFGRGQHPSSSGSPLSILSFLGFGLVYFDVQMVD